jgi:hypothetical protein
MSSFIMKLMSSLRITSGNKPKLDFNVTCHYTERPPSIDGLGKHVRCNSYHFLGQYKSTNSPASFSILIDCNKENGYKKFELKFRMIGGCLMMKFLLFVRPIQKENREKMASTEKEVLEQNGWPICQKSSISSHQKALIQINWPPKI